MPKLRHLELFSGIGGFRRAIDLFCDDNNIESDCIGFSEIDKFARQTYEANFDTKNEISIGDIEEFTADINNIKNLPNFDLLSGGFPCQAFSMMGNQLGFEDKRGNLFYSIIKILNVKRPKYVLLENVRNLKNHDKGNTFKEIKRSLEEDSGYIVTSDVFNSEDFGLPQVRRRIFIFAIRKDLVNNSIKLDSLSVKKDYEIFNKSSSLLTYRNVLDGLLDKNVDKKYYLSEKLKPTILADGSKNFKSKSEINKLIARPLTATMVKMHRACQDNYYSEDFINHNDPLKYLETKFTKEELSRQNIRKLTPLEALKLQGFNKDFFENANMAGVSNHQLYKQSGNAVSVNTVYSILQHLYISKKIEV